MLTINCPSCGANVKFVSKASIFAVCSYCKSSLVRHDMDLEAVGKISEIQNDLTPIQVGTSGMFEGQKFEVIGRLKVAYDNGFWNEWCAYRHDGQVAWLAEAQGFYALCMPFFEVAMPPQTSMKPGRLVDFGSHGPFEVEDVHEVTCVYSEGELPVNAVQGRKSLSVDLTGRDNGMATIEYSENETRVFCGAYQDFDQFQFKNLRHIDGW